MDKDPKTWLLQQRKNGKFCDMLLIASESEEKMPILAHKVIMCRCPYFEQLIAESNEYKKTFAIGGIDHSTLEQLVDHIYTGETVLIDEQSWWPLYEGCKTLKLDQIIIECKKFFKTMINAANVLIFWIRLHENGDESLIECALQRIFEHLEEVCKTKEFADLDLNQLKMLQNQARGKQHCPIDILFLTISWMKIDFNVRKDVVSVDNIDMINIKAFTLRKMIVCDKIVRRAEIFFQAYHRTIDRKIETIDVVDCVFCCEKHNGAMTSVQNVEQQREDFKKKELELEAREQDLAQREEALKKSKNSFDLTKKRYQTSIKKRMNDSGIVMTGRKRKSSEDSWSSCDS